MSQEGYVFENNNTSSQKQGAERKKNKQKTVTKEKDKQQVGVRKIQRTDYFQSTGVPFCRKCFKIKELNKKTMNEQKEEIVAATIRCINFAAIKHSKQRRKDPEKTPYINHPIGVAYILTEEGKVYDLDVIQAALLHDTVEDTDTTLDELESVFGKTVRDIVDEVTDDKELPKLERKRLQIIHAGKSSHSAKLVKLADKLYNLRDLERATPEGWSAERVKEYFMWAKQVIDNLRGTNLLLERKLDEVFQRNIS